MIFLSGSVKMRISFDSGGAGAAMNLIPVIPSKARNLFREIWRKYRDVCDKQNLLSVKKADSALFVNICPTSCRDYSTAV